MCLKVLQPGCPVAFGRGRGGSPGIVPWALAVSLLAVLASGCGSKPDPYGRQVTRAMEYSLRGQEVLSEGDDRLAQRDFTKSLKINQSIDNPLGASRQFNNLGALAMTRGDNAEAKKFFQRALFVNQELGDAAGAAVNLANLATLAQKSRNLPLAESYLQQARDAARLSGSAKVNGQVLCQMAGLALDQGDPSAAALFLEEARPAARQAEVRGAWNYQQGRVCLARGDSVQARQFFQEALAADRHILNRTGMGADLQGLGAVWEAQADFPRSFLYYSRAFDLYAATNSLEKAQRCLDTLRRLNKTGKLGRSLKLFERQLEAAQAAAAPCPPPKKDKKEAKEKGETRERDCLPSVK